MPAYVYRVKEPDGSDTQGWLEAESEEELIRLLHRQGKIILSVEPMRQARGGRRGGEMALRLFGPKIRTQELALFASQLSAMVDAGLPLLRAIRVLMEEAENIRLKRILSDVALRLEAGSSFADALNAHPVFGTLFVSLVRAGEMSGRLDATLKQMAAYLDRTDSLRRRIRNALTYPSFLLGFSLLVVVVLVVWLIPAFSRVYDKFRARIPGPTLLLMDVSHFIRENIPWIAVGVALAGGLAWMALRTERGRYMRDAFLLRVPLVGGILLSSALARFSRTLGVLIGSGIPFLEALELAIGATDHRVLRRALVESSVEIEGGVTIARALEKRGLFPRMLISMIATGEEVGTLSTMLLKAADHYDQRVEARISGFMALLEPVMILFLGGMIGGILLAMYLPVFTLGRAIR